MNDLKEKAIMDNAKQTHLYEVENLRKGITNDVRNIQKEISQIIPNDLVSKQNQIIDEIRMNKRRLPNTQFNDQLNNDEIQGEAFHKQKLLSNNK